MSPTSPRTFLACLSLGFAASASAASAPEDLQIFLLIGQSNMAGRGPVEEQDRQPHARVFMLNRDLAWVPAVDPIHFDKPERIGTGLGKTFGTLVAEAEPDAVIGLVPAAFGGSALDEWQPGQPHYLNAVARAREALKHGTLAGILWHQGESDREPTKAATYAARFAKFIAQLRGDLGAENVPVVVGEIGHFCPNEAAVNAAIRSLPALVPHCALVTTEGLEGLPEQPEVLHFVTPAFRELGRRYAAAYLELAQPAAPLKPVMLVPKKN